MSILAVLTAAPLDGMLQPLVFCGLLAAGLSLCLYLFASLKAALRVVERRRPADQPEIRAMEDAVSEMRLSVARLESELREVQANSGMLVQPVEAKSGLNLSKRTQVLRLHRAGNDECRIAATLGLPRAEVDLLIKVHRIALEQI